MLISISVLFLALLHHVVAAWCPCCWFFFLPPCRRSFPVHGGLFFIPQYQKSVPVPGARPVTVHSPCRKSLVSGASPGLALGARLFWHGECTFCNVLFQEPEDFSGLVKVKGLFPGTGSFSGMRKCIKTLWLSEKMFDSRLFNPW